MPSTPSDTKPESWHRYYAVVANNLAWSLAEQRTDATKDAAMLEAAHASAWHWRAIGTELNHMRATMLLARVHALVGDGSTALAHAITMRDYFLAKAETPDWEVAFVHTVLAHAAHAADETALHAQAYEAASASIAAIADDKERAIVLRTYRQVPAPH